MTTEKLYQEDVYLKSCQATVLKVISKEQLISEFKEQMALFPKETLAADQKCCCLVLDKTVFFPEGGGQPSDQGTINNSSVLHVAIDDNTATIYHLVSSDQFQAGQNVDLNINWPWRFQNMQRHCGEHILSGVIYHLWEGVNRGFHMGENYMTIDIDLSHTSGSDYLTMEQLVEAQNMTNRIIWENLPVVTHHFKTKDEALESQIKLRKPLAIDKDITIVTVGHTDNPADSVACCGTHPQATGQVGLLKIYKCEKNKYMTRIYFDSGVKAMNHIQKQSEAFDEIAYRLSASTSDIVQKLDTLCAHLDEEKEKVAGLTSLHLSQIAQDIMEKLLALENDKQRSFQFFSINCQGVLNSKDLQRLSKILLSKAGFAHNIVIYLANDQDIKSTAVILSKDYDCGTLIKDARKLAIDITGGGRGQSGQLQGTVDAINLFMEFINGGKSIEG